MERKLQKHQTYEEQNMHEEHVDTEDNFMEEDPEAMAKRLDQLDQEPLGIEINCPCPASEDGAEGEEEPVLDLILDIEN